MSIAFEPLLQAATDRFGSKKALQEQMPELRSVAELELISNDRYLSAMCLRVFRAGMKHSVVDAKWRRFDEVFYNFEPHQLATLTDEQLEALMNKDGLIKHWAKIKSIRTNAQFVLDVSEQFGSFGHWVATWPVQDIVGLWAEISKSGAQLGGKSAPYFLRYVGKDTFIFTGDVIAALTELDVINGNAETKANLASVQKQFNEWHDETGLPFCYISKILALSVNQHLPVH